MITGYLGVIGGGKDFACEAAQRHGAVRVDFKDALLDMCSDIVGYDVREDYITFKKRPLGIRGHLEAWQEHALQLLTHIFPGIVTGRTFLCRLGTETMRKRDRDYWVRAWMTSAYNERRHVVVADCRFTNEVAAIHLGGESEFVFCDWRNDIRYDPNHQHDSEKLAQTLLKMGCMHREVLTLDKLAKACALAFGDDLHQEIERLRAQEKSHA